MIKFVKLFHYIGLFLIVLFWGECVNSANLYEKNYQEIKVGEYKLWGCFDSPCNIDPDQINIFGYSTKYFSVGFYYIGRTGEKTFDLLKSDTDYSKLPFKKEEKISHIYFDPNDLLYLFHTGPFKNQGCTKDDNIYLRMLDLKGNRLKFQIILPECMKNNK